jgi:recombination protein RecT
MSDKALTKIDRFKAVINQPTVQEQFKNALGRHSDLFIASLIDVYNGGLQKCDPSGVIQEALKAAVLKLPISKSLGFAYLVPYAGKVQFQIGYKGMIQLAMRSGQLKVLNADLVYEGEYQGYDRISGELDICGKRTGNQIVGYFVYMELVNGFRKIEYWSREKIISHAEAKSPSYKNKRSAWFTDFDAMAKKTVLRSLLSKYAPMSIEFLTALNQDEPESSENKLVDLEMSIPPESDKKNEQLNLPENAHPEQDADEEFNPEPGF